MRHILQVVSAYEILPMFVGRALVLFMVSSGGKALAIVFLSFFASNA